MLDRDARELVAAMRAIRRTQDFAYSIVTPLTAWLNAGAARVALALVSASRSDEF
jgi:hypothetical protein